LKIALINLISIENLQSSIDCFEKMNKEIIDLNIDIYTEDNYMDELEQIPFVKASYPMHLKNISFIDYRDKYKNLRYYAKQNKYDIAVDTQCSFKSALVTYFISGRTAGFRVNSFSGKIIAKLFYDEVLDIQDKSEIDTNMQELFAKSFGYDLD
jgi:ADP-heptose:LPS heptosyltransferase